MTTTIRRIGLVALALALVSPLAADELEERQKEERRKQEAFRAGFTEIINDLNYQIYETLIEAIDRDDMVDRIYGLRLIDQKVKRSFEENLENSWPYMVQSGAAFLTAGIVPSRGVPESGLRVRLVGIESRGDRGRAVIRQDLEKHQFNYQEFDLRLTDRDEVQVIDWVDYLTGLTFSDSIGRYLVMATPGKPALRKLLDIPNANDRELYLFGELMKAARDGNLGKYFEVRDTLPPRIQKQRIVVETSVQLARAARQRRVMVDALGIMAEHYPDEPRYTLMLLDYFFPQKKYQQGIAALRALADEIGFPDAAMEARISAAELAAGNVGEAVAYADAALQREPTLELAWLSALNARNAAADYAGAVAALTRLEADFGYDLGPENLEKSRVFSDLMRSSEFRAWLGTRPTGN